jgi:hypothetical protein
MSYLGVNIKKIFGKYVAPKTRSLVFYKAFPRTRTAGNLTHGRNVEVEAFPCSGFVAEYKEYDVDGALVKRGDKKLVIYSDTLATTPTVNDYVVDHEGNWYTIVDLKAGASEAEWILQGRETSSSRTVLVRATVTSEFLWNIE